MPALMAKMEGAWETGERDVAKRAGCTLTKIKSGHALRLSAPEGYRRHRTGGKQSLAPSQHGDPTEVDRH